MEGPPGLACSLAQSTNSPLSRCKGRTLCGSWARSHSPRVVWSAPFSRPSKFIDTRSGPKRSASANEAPPLVNLCRLAGVISAYLTSRQSSNAGIWKIWKCQVGQAPWWPKNGKKRRNERPFSSVGLGNLQCGAAETPLRQGIAFGVRLLALERAQLLSLAGVISLVLQPRRKCHPFDAGELVIYF